MLKLRARSADPLGMATAPLPEPESALPDPVAGLTPPTHPGRSPRLIGDVVVDLGFATREAVEFAVTTGRNRGRTTGRVLLETGVLDPDQFARVLAERFGVDYVDLALFDVHPGAVELIAVDAARRYQSVPVGFAGEELLLAMADPTNVLALDDVAMLTGLRVRPAAASAERIRALIARRGAALDGSATRQTGSAAASPVRAPGAVEFAGVGRAPDEPALRVVQSIIGEAVAQGASDIHCDPEADELRVHFRMDGLLRPAMTVPAPLASAVVSRLKILAGMEIADKRAPQDGRLSLTVDGRVVDVRVVTLPLVRGEAVVMRIVDGAITVRDLSELGMLPEELTRLRRAIARRSGGVLVTGPSGSGKTTTLYGALEAIGVGERSVLTIEDPVEAVMPGVKQMEVSTRTGVSFASGLRSILRADPEVIMVGEIRDLPTAELAMQSALTGHLVLSSLHTRDAPSAVSRLVEMGVEPFLVAPALECVVAQRLARRLCEHCKRPSPLPPGVMDGYQLEGAQPFEAVGCEQCAASGYRGRVGLYEVLPVSDDLRTLVLERASAEEIALFAAAQGMRRMRDDGIEKVRLGLTSLAEVSRVTSLH